MQNETYWAATLPTFDLLQKVATGTNVIRDGEANTHAAGGRGPFGKLTQLGLLQMVDLGNTLREQLQADVVGDHHLDDHGNVFLNNGRLFDPTNPIRPRHVKVVSTDFQRTILSVQGTLIGIFPDPEKEPIDIDVRHTSIMIPDPQPRRSAEQVELEQVLASRKHLQEREDEMLALAVQTTASLLHLLGEGAHGVSFGIGEEKGSAGAPDATKPLAWAQLAEITKCLAVRDLLPDTISIDDQEAIAAHTAWKWFENLRHPRLAYLAMNPMVTTMIESMHTKLEKEEEPAVIIYSAHDSTLIGLLCAFRLEQPSVWPEYGSYLKLELLEAVTTKGETQLLVRFSLNGEILKSQWAEGESLEAIPLDRLTENIKLDGSDCN
jgi:Histidine phosphatase superfamily (branch 2)